MQHRAFDHVAGNGPSGGPDIDKGNRVPPIHGAITWRHLPISRSLPETSPDAVIRRVC